MLNDDPSDKTIKVLHVDSDMSFLLVSKEILHFLGDFEIDLVTSVLEAYAAMEKKQYDVILSECWIRDKDGLKFLKELRENKNKIPFIMFSINENREIAEALKLDAIPFIEKSGKPEEVFTNVSNIIKQCVHNKRCISPVYTIVPKKNSGTIKRGL